MTLNEQIKELESKLSSLNNKQAKFARQRALSRSSKRMATLVSSETAKKERLKSSLIKRKIRIKELKRQGIAAIIIGRTAIPAIYIGQARTQIKRRNGAFLTSAAQRDTRGRFAKRAQSGNTAIRVGRHKFDDAFLQRLASGRWHIMQRKSERRYPIDIAKIPIRGSITAASDKHSKYIINDYLPNLLIKDMNYRINKLSKWTNASTYVKKSLSY